MCCHGVVAGYQMMRQYESPKYVFDFCTRYLAKAPPFIIYDNGASRRSPVCTRFSDARSAACRLADYCMRRLPRWWRRCRFFTDAFHASGHVRCSSSHDFRWYRRHFTDGIGTSMVESMNAQLQKLKSMSMYMVRVRIPCASCLLTPGAGDHGHGAGAVLVQVRSHFVPALPQHRGSPEDAPFIR